MKYTTLGFALFKKCTAACDICCFSSTPQDKERLDVEKIKTFIRQASQNKDLRTISITGGEPFMEFDLLKDLVLFITQNGKEASCITNGFWATDFDTAFQMLLELKKRGLKKLSVSHDRFHRKYVKTQNIRHLLKASEKLGILVSLGIAKMKNDKVGELVDSFENDLNNVQLQIFSVYPSGRAKECFKPNEFCANFPSLAPYRCPYNGYMAVDFNGKIFPCCSQLVVDTELYVGNYADTDFETALSNIKNHGILFLLRNIGIDFFARIAKEELDIHIPETVSSPCEICSLLFTKEHIHKFYPYVKAKLQEVKDHAKLSSH